MIFKTISVRRTIYYRLILFCIFYFILILYFTLSWYLWLFNAVLRSPYFELNFIGKTCDKNKSTNPKRFINKNWNHKTTFLRRSTPLSSSFFSFFKFLLRFINYLATWLFSNKRRWNAKIPRKTKPTRHVNIQKKRYVAVKLGVNRKSLFRLFCCPLVF